MRMALCGTAGFLNSSSLLVQGATFFILNLMYLATNVNFSLNTQR